MLCAEIETAKDQIEAVNFSFLMTPVQLKDVFDSRKTLSLLRRIRDYNEFERDS